MLSHSLSFTYWPDGLALFGVLVCQQVAKFGSCFLILSGSSVGTQFHGLSSLFCDDKFVASLVVGKSPSVLYSLNTAILSLGNKHAAQNSSHSLLWVNVQHSDAAFLFVGHSTFSLSHSPSLRGDGGRGQSGGQCLQLQWRNEAKRFLSENNESFSRKLWAPCRLVCQLALFLFSSYSRLPSVFDAVTLFRQMSTLYFGITRPTYSWMKLAAPIIKHSM